MFKRIGKKSIFLWMTLLCCFIPGKAQDAVKMIQSDGQETIFMLSQKPTVSMNGSSILIETENESVSCQIEDGIRFEFVNYGSNSLESLVENTPVFKVSQETIEAEGLTPAIPVAIYDITGKLVKSSQTDSSGNVSLNISDLSSGVYIFNSVNKNFKFYKR